MPADAAVRVRIEVPEPPAIVAVLRVATSPIDGLTVSVTIPLNPWRDVIVSVEVADCITSTAPGVEAERMKSCALYFTVAVWDVNPVLDAVRVTV